MEHTSKGQADRTSPLETDEQRRERWKQMGARIKEARGAKSQQALANELSEIVPETRRRTRAAIAQYESGTNPPSFQTMYDLAHVLQVNAEFLITGELPPAQAGAYTVNWAERGRLAKMYSLPPSLISEFGIGEMDLEWVKLAVDASAFGVQLGDYVLVDKGVSKIVADGSLYALKYITGASVARSEAVPTTDGSIMLTTGKNATVSVAPESIATIGRVVAIIKNNP